MIILRKMIRPHLFDLAEPSSNGGARLLETLQETVQGIRIVKAYTMEDVMRARLEKNVTELEHEVQQVGARGAPREPADGRGSAAWPSRARWSMAASACCRPARRRASSSRSSRPSCWPMSRRSGWRGSTSS